MDDAHPELEKKPKVPNKFLLIFALAALFVGFLGLLSIASQSSSDSVATTQTEQASISPEAITATTTEPVSSSSEDYINRDRRPRLSISGGREAYSGGGTIALASTDEPSIKIGGYDLSGEATVALFESNQEALLKYLVHNSEGKQLNKTVDTNSMRRVAEFKHQLKPQQDESKLLLPLSEQGIWAIQIKFKDTTEYGFIIRSGFGVVAKEGDNEHIFWGQSFKTKRSIGEGTIKLYALQDSLKEVSSASFGADGIAKAPISRDVDIAIAQFGDDRAMVPINLRYFDSKGDYRVFEPKKQQTKYFIFTDRPLYKPGDTVHFKAILRNDDDARYTIPSGQAAIRFYSSHNESDPVLEKNYSISEDGTVSGEYVIAANGTTGHYRLDIQLPGSSLETTSFQVEHFRKPEYTVDIDVADTVVTVGDQSSFTVSGEYFSGQPLASEIINYKIYSGDYYDYEYINNYPVDLSDSYRYGDWYGTSIAEGSTVTNSTGKATVKFTPEPSSENSGNQVHSIEVEFDDGSGNPAFSRKNILVYAGEFDIYRKEGSYSTKVGSPLVLPVVLKPHESTKVSDVELEAKIHRENWVPYLEKDQKYPSYRKEEEDLTPLKAKTDSKGDASFSFTPKKVGSHKITVEAKDSRGNVVTKEFYTYASTDETGIYSDYEDNDLTVLADKETYKPSDTAQLTISSTVADRDVLLTLDRARVNRYQVVRLSGRGSTVSVPLVDTDLPNIYAIVSSFSGHDLDVRSADLTIVTDSKKLNVKVSPSKQNYKPGESVVVDLLTTDEANKPLSAEVALWSVDKAIFELSGDKTGEVFETFWAKRYSDTAQAHSLEGINVEEGAEMGGGGGDPRTALKDTAYWNPSIRTDSSGKAQISFKAPDNLTTWVLAAVGSTRDTRVGQATKEVKVSKDIVIRPLLPNILREGDEAVLSAYVHNFTNNEQDFATQLTFDSGSVKEVGDPSVVVSSQTNKLVSWKVVAQKVKDAAKFVFSVAPESDLSGDTISQSIPIRAYGFTDRKVQTGEGTKSFAVKPSADMSKERSTLTLSLAPTLSGTVSNAVQYLSTYPYDCAEQTTSKLVSSLIAKSNPNTLVIPSTDKDLNQTMREQVAHLVSLQHADGGWSWWFSGASDPFISAYVIEHLLAAQQSGIQVNKTILDSAQRYFELLEKPSPENAVAKTYALTMLGSSQGRTQIAAFDSLKPDILSMAVMANIKNGNKNADTNGLKRLISLAKDQGDGVFWEAGSKQSFGSIDASTGYAVRAILVSGSHKEIVAKAVRYLSRNRQADYWSNTFATAQISHALIEYARINQEFSPNYTYTVLLDGKQIANGLVNNPKQLINEIVIPLADVKAGGSELVVNKSGTGELYSTLVLDEFRTDRKAKAVNNGLAISREYVSDSGAGARIAVGDEVTVNLTISGLKAEENYGALVDELPAGLVPINESLDNEQYGNEIKISSDDYNITDRVITENGMILSLYRVPSGERTYSYRARAVSEGSFIAPPAVATLMYAPEISGRSATQVVKIGNTRGVTPVNGGLVVVAKSLLVLVVIIIAAVVVLLIVALRNRKQGLQTIESENSPHE